jgi:hypothetical protein
VGNVSEAEVRALASGYGFGDVPRWRVFVTALRSFGQLPGAQFSRRIWFPSWLIGVLLSLLIIGGSLWLLSLQGEGGFVTWLAAVPFFVGASLAELAVFTLFAPLLHVFFYPMRKNYIALCDPGNAFLGATYVRRIDGTWVLNPKGFGAVRRGRGLADDLISTLLSRVTELGGVQIESKAQTMQLAEKYYAGRFGFDYDLERRIFFPGSGKLRTREFGDNN